MANLFRCGGVPPIITSVFTIFNGYSVSSGYAPAVSVDLSTYTTNLTNYNVYFVSTKAGTYGNAKCANITCTVVDGTHASVLYPIAAACDVYLRGYFILIKK